MWFRKGNREEQIQAIHSATYARIDKAVESIDRNTASIDKLNQYLEERGDVAYNMFVGTGGLRRQQDADRKGKKK